MLAYRFIIALFLLLLITLSFSKCGGNSEYYESPVDSIGDQDYGRYGESKFGEKKYY